MLSFGLGYLAGYESGVVSGWSLEDLLPSHSLDKLPPFAAPLLGLTRTMLDNLKESLSLLVWANTALLLLLLPLLSLTLVLLLLLLVVWSKAGAGLDLVVRERLARRWGEVRRGLGLVVWGEEEHGHQD